MRLTVTLLLGAALAIGTVLGHVNLVRGVATLAKSVTSGGSSTSSTGSAAGAVYCGPGSGTGSTGWAPTNRWHYGFPAGLGTADDGWSPSVQATCPSGMLSITWHDDNISLAPGHTLYGGYDFHQANKPAFTYTEFTPTITFSPISCSNGKKPSVTSITMTMSTRSYFAPANMPNWIPTGVKTDPAGFQGTLVVPNVCSGGNVIFSGGVFSTTVQIT